MNFNSLNSYRNQYADWEKWCNKVIYRYHNESFVQIPISIES